MKKRTILFLAIVLSFFLNINLVKAASIKVSGGNVEPGKSIELDINIEGDDLKDYGKLEFSIQVDPDVNAKIDTLTSNVGTGYTFNKKDNNTFVFEIPENNETITSLSVNKVATISISTTDELNGNFRVTPTNVKFYKLDGELSEKTVNTVVGTVVYVAPKSSEASLTDLVLSTTANKSLTFTPKFSSKVFEYKAIVDDTITNIKISATPCAKAKISGGGTHKLVMGENKFKIVVTAEDGVTEVTYKVTVVKVTPSAYIKDLYVDNIGCGDLSPEFDKLNNKYTITVPKSISKLDFKYELEDAAAKVEINGNKNFVAGENKVTITVTSSDKKDKQVYEIVVIKESNIQSTVSPDDETDTEVNLPSNGDFSDKEKKEPRYWLIALLAVLVLGIFAGVILILFKKKRKQKKIPEVSREKAPSLIKKDLKNEKNTNAEVLSKTTTYNKKDFIDPENKEEDLEKTKEFNFKDFI